MAAGARGHLVLSRVVEVDLNHDQGLAITQNQLTGVELVLEFPKQSTNVTVTFAQVIYASLNSVSLPTSIKILRVLLNVIAFISMNGSI